MQSANEIEVNVKKITKRDQVTTITFFKPIQFQHGPGQYIILNPGKDTWPLYLAIATGTRETSKGTFKVTFQNNPPHAEKKSKNKSFFLDQTNLDFRVQINGPNGQALDSGQLGTENSQVHLFAGGIGITPVRAILHSLRPDALQNTRVYLSVKSIKDFAYPRLITKLQNDKKNIITLTREKQDPYYHGRMPSHLSMVEMQQNDKAFICGPREFVKDIAITLIAKGLAKENILIICDLILPEKKDKAPIYSYAELQDILGQTSSEKIRQPLKPQ